MTCRDGRKVSGHLTRVVFWCFLNLDRVSLHWNSTMVDLFTSGPGAVPFIRLFLSSLHAFFVSPQEVLGVRIPRRRWSGRAGSAEDSALVVKSMLDLRLLDSYCPNPQEEQQEEVLLQTKLFSSYMS